LLERNIGRAMQRVDEMDYRLRQSAIQGFTLRRERWRLLDVRLRQLDLRLRFAAAHRRIDAADAARAHAIAAALGRARRAFEPLAAKLHQLSPLKILERGYAIVQDAGGRILKEAAATEPRAGLKVRLAKGRLEVTVDRILG
jgi:exodeoxyribonuclease VII large subunit